MITLISISLILTGVVFFSILYIISLQPASLALRIGDKSYKLCGFIRIASMLFEMIAISGYIMFVFGDSFNYTISVNHSFTVRIIGVIFSLLTLGFMIWGVKDAGKEATVPNKDTKLYGGIYKYMRHPQTLGEMLSWFGFALILNSLTLFVFSFLMIPLFMGYTIIEDNDLAVRFGADYIEYAKRTGIFWTIKKK